MGKLGRVRGIALVLCSVVALSVLPARPAAATAIPAKPRAAAAIIPRTPHERAVAPPGRTILVSSEPFFGAYVRFGARNPIVREDGNEVLWWGSIPPYVFNPVIAFDVATGSQTVVSLGLSGELLNADLNFGASPDGRFVAFVGPVPVQTECCSDFRREVLLRDRLAGTTTLVSVTPTGQPSMNASPANPAVSRDGRYVVFESQANDLTPENGSNLGNSYVYLRDLGGGLTTRISPPESVNAGGGRKPKISADGRYVVFQGNSGVWSFDRFSSNAEIIGRDRSGAAVPTAQSPVISGDGRFIAYDAFSDAIVADDTNGTSDVFLFDRTDRSTRRVSLGTDGVQGDRSSFTPSLSGDGRFVAFQSNATNFAPDTTDANGTLDIFVRDLQLDRTTLVSVSVAGATPNNSSSAASVSADGTRVAFASGATDLMPLVDTNSRPDAFLRDLRATNTAPVVTAGGDGSAQVGVEFRRQVSFTDPDTQTWRASVTFGDGASASFDLGTSRSFTLAHTYTALSTYTVEVVVTDSGGASGTDHFRVEIPNQTPAVNAGGDTTVFEGDHLIRTASFTDLDFGPWLVTIDYGDHSALKQFGLDGNQSFTLDHAYEVGEFDVAVTVADSLHATGRASFHVMVRNVPPTILVEQPSTAYLDATFTLAGSFTDPGVNENYSISVDFGDHSAVSHPNISDRTFAATHRYTQLGIHAGSVTVADSNGEASVLPFAVTVMRRPIIFIPGIAGSTLVATSQATVNVPDGHGATRGISLSPGDTLWVNFPRWKLDPDYFDVLKFLPNGVPYYDGARPGVMFDSPRADGTYGEVVPILKAAGYDYPNLRVFVYDWRYSAGDPRTIAKLDGLVADTLETSGADSVDIIAHSMGTLVTRVYLRDGRLRERIANAVLLGSPQTGTTKGLIAAAYGECIWIGPVCGLSAEEIQDVMHTLPGAIEFVPSKAFWDAVGEPESPEHPRPYRDIRGRAYRPGYPGTTDLLVDQGASQLVIAAAEAFHTTDVSWLDSVRAKVMFVTGIGYCTPSQLFDFSSAVPGQAAVDHRDVLQADGDGTVLWYSPGPPAANTESRKRTVFVNARHGVELISHGGLDAALDILHERGHGLEPSVGGGCKTVHVFSPAVVVVTDSQGRRSGNDGVQSFAEIPASDVDQVGETKLVTLNGTGAYTVAVFGTGAGSTTLKVTWTTAGALTRTVLYPTVPTTSRSRGTFMIDDTSAGATELAWDTDGDGVVDLRPQPTVLTGAAAADQTPPVLAIDPALGARTIVGGTALNWTATDPESGLSGTWVVIDPGTTTPRRADNGLVVLSAGTHTIDFVAQDRAGLAASVSRSVTALGLEWVEPLGSGAFEGNAGRSIPVKFTIRAADGTPFARQVATLEIRDATGRVAVGPIGSGTNPANGIAVVGNDMYHAVVPTTGLAPGTYDLVLRFDASDVTGEVHRTLTLH